MDWKKKLTSRKFWAALAGFVTGLIVFIKNPTSDAQAVTALILSLGTLVAYIIGEGLVDASSAGKTTLPEINYLVSKDGDITDADEAEAADE